MGYKMRNKNLMTFLVSILLLLSIEGVIAGNKVLFYESKVSGNYKIETDYSQFREELEKNGYDVDKIEVELSRDVLKTRNPDVLVIPNLGSDLTPDEMTALFRFIMEDGKGLFLCGATPSVNKFTIPLGMTLDKHILEDESNKIRDMSSGKLIEDETIFYIELPMERSGVVKTLTQGVSKLYFFGGNGIYVFGNAMAVVTGGKDTNSPKSLRFPKGTYPPIAAYARVGKGSVFLLSDPDMLSNKNLDSSKYRHDNMKFAINVVDWLSTPFPGEMTEDEFEIIVKTLQKKNKELNRTIINLRRDNEDLLTRINKLESEKMSLQQDIENLKKGRVGILGIWLEYQTLAILLLAFVIFIAIAVFIQKTKKEKKMGKRGELGYEFEEGSGKKSEFGPGIREEDVEERLKEFEEISE